ERRGIARTLLYGRFIRIDGAVKLIIAQRAVRFETTQSMGIATVEESFWVYATAFEGTLQGLDGLVIALLLKQQRAHAIVGLGPLWLLGYRPFEVFQGCFGLALVCQGEA